MRHPPAQWAPFHPDAPLLPSRSTPTTTRQSGGTRSESRDASRPSDRPQRGGPRPAGSARTPAPASARPRCVTLRSAPGTPKRSTGSSTRRRASATGPVFQTAIATGLRKGELLGLEWPDVDFAKGTLRVERQRLRTGAFGPTKSDAGVRTIGLNALAVEALRAQRTRQKEDRLRAGSRWSNPHELVFATSRAPLPQPGRSGVRSPTPRRQLASAPSGSTTSATPTPRCS